MSKGKPTRATVPMCPRHTAIERCLAELEPLLPDVQSFAQPEEQFFIGKCPKCGLETNQPIWGYYLPPDVAKLEVERDLLRAVVDADVHTCHLAEHKGPCKRCPAVKALEKWEASHG